jgi:hypothetical protein
LLAQPAASSQQPAAARQQPAAQSVNKNEENVFNLLEGKWLPRKPHGPSSAV